MFLLSIIIPGFNFFLLFFGGFLLGRKSGIQLSLIGNCISYLLIIYYLKEVLYTGNTYYLPLGTFLQIGILTLQWGFLVDTYTIVMCFVISTISLMVLFYSLEYMSKDPYKLKFYSYLNLFTFFMYIFVTSENLVQMFFGWEGIGICSYLLIIFWDTRVSAKKSAIKAVVVNKIGDLAVMLVICMLFVVLGTAQAITVRILPLYSLLELIIVQGSYLTFSLVNLIAILILIAVVGKSAQVGLHIWLPDAMEGPTPVSALLHAATMVTAGIFLTLRFSILLEISTINYWYAFIGSVTALYASILGFCQEDLKKSIAYSTCSQLGYMVLVCSLGGYNISFFHLFNHAFFKALLFLTAGCLIHISDGEQDLRVLGGYILRVPLIFSTMFIAGTSLLALPFLSGFFSKELIINSGFFYATIDSSLCLFFCLIAAVFTSLYTILNTFDLFIGDLYHKNLLKFYHQTSTLMSSILLFLTLFSIWSGYLFVEVFLGLGGSGVAPQSMSNILPLIDMETLTVYHKYLPIVFSLIFSLYSIGLADRYFINISRFLFHYLNLDEFYFKIFNLSTWVSLGIFTVLLDRSIIESVGPKGQYRFISYVSFYTGKIGMSGVIGHITIILAIIWIPAVTSLAPFFY